MRPVQWQAYHAARSAKSDAAVDELRRAIDAAVDEGRLLKIKPFFVERGWKYVAGLGAKFKRVYGTPPKRLYLDLWRQKHGTRSPRARVRRARTSEVHAAALLDEIDAAVDERRPIVVQQFLRERGMKTVSWVHVTFTKLYGRAPRAFYVARVVDRVRALQEKRPTVKPVWLALEVLPRGTGEALVTRVLAALGAERVAA